MSKVGVLSDQSAAAMAIAHAAGSTFHSNGKLVTKWSVTEVCNWLSQIGYADIVPIFRKHEISGPVLSKLNDAVLKEMGVHVIGHRLLLMNEVVKIQIVARNEWRNQVIWTSDEYREGPCNNYLPYNYPWHCECCVGRPNTYTLTNGKVTILQSAKVCNCPGFLWCGVRIESNNIDLSDIVDVDVNASTGFVHDPLGVVGIRDKQGGYYPLYLRSSQCQKTCALITNAREEATAAAVAMTMVR